MIIFIKSYCDIFQGLDGHVICAALLSQYCMMDYETAQVTDLFPIDVDHTKPIVKRISKVCLYSNITVKFCV